MRRSFLGISRNFPDKNKTDEILKVSRAAGTHNYLEPPVAAHLL